MACLGPVLLWCEHHVSLPRVTEETLAYHQWEKTGVGESFAGGGGGYPVVGNVVGVTGIVGGTVGVSAVVGVSDASVGRVTTGGDWSPPPSLSMMTATMATIARMTASATLLSRLMMAHSNPSTSRRRTHRLM